MRFCDTSLLRGPKRAIRGSRAKRVRDVRALSLSAALIFGFMKFIAVFQTCFASQLLVVRRILQVVPGTSVSAVFFLGF